jgi:hypothetical protein
MHTDIYGREHRYAPPQGWVQPASESIGPADWDALVATGLSFRPYDGATQARIVRGTCLNPLLIAGDLLRVRHVAPDEPLADGGMYCIKWNNEEETQRYRDSIGVPCTEPIIITKLLRYVGMEWWCQCADSLCALDGEVVGEVVGHSRPQAVHAFAAQLGLHAATTAGAGQLISSITLGVVRNLASASIVVPTGETWPVAVNGIANISLGTSPSGACNLQQNGVTVQGPDGWGAGDAGTTMNCPFSYIATLTGGTYAFTITGFNSSGGATHNSSTVTVTVLKR